MNESDNESQRKFRFSVRKIDKFLHNLHTNRSRFNKLITIGISFLTYALIILLFGNHLKVSSNYFIIIPLIAVSFSFGFKGGIPAGVFSLPLNLLMFQLLGHPEYAPQSKLIAEISGIVFGTILGYLSDYYYEIEVEIERRRIAEEKLQQLINEKEILIQEIHHRVKNNLNIVKSLIQLQLNRSNNKEFIEEAEKLIRRIFSISKVHEQLYKGDRLTSQSLGKYIPTLIKDILAGLDEGRLAVKYIIEIPETEITLEQATSLGLIINEVLTNAIKYSLSLVESPELEVVLRKEPRITIIELINNAPTFIPGPEECNGLGLKLIKTLCDQLNAYYEYLPSRGTTFRLILPEVSYRQAELPS
ncbi:MAG: sensor histidine kinase [Spirochaetales bacterium]|nr:sensor histidine kinase [Spirochaetales bacterium]